MEKTKYDGNKVVAWSECDWKPRKPKLSEAIRIGAKMLPPSKPGARTYFQDGCRACALGAAWYALTGQIERDGVLIGERICRLVGIDPLVREKASEFFETGAMTREQVADWLEAQGY